MLDHICLQDQPKHTLFAHHRRLDRVDIRICWLHHSNRNRKYDNWSDEQIYHTNGDSLVCWSVVLRVIVNQEKEKNLV